jgi:ribosomal protein S18 acetylase RimI-like enzyme
MLSSPLDRVLPLTRHATVFPRNFMAARLTPARRFTPRASAGKLRFENWKEDHTEAAAQLIAAAYHGHVDSRINDQYRSSAGARRFLQNIVHYPGCGMFFQPASFLCRTQWDEALGLILSSLVSEDFGHITQVCVAGQARGYGLGFELMRRSMEALAFYGCRGVSLTVTTANQNAVRLYEQMGFATERRFGAFVWEGF